MNRKDVSAIAGGLLYFLKHEVSVEKAIEKFFQRYAAMEELNANHAEFIHALKRFSKKVLVDKQRFAKLKFFVAAVISIMDMLTDIGMCFEYIGRGDKWYAWATLASIGVNLTFQSVGAGIQNHNKPWQRQLWEQLFVWCLAKPGVIAWRVSSGSAHEVGMFMNAETELTFNKSVELVTEVVPGSLIQLAAILCTSGTSKTAILSFLLCIGSAGFTSACMSWDWDMSRNNRVSCPWFYGYIPTDGRGKVKVFASLFILAGSNLFIRSFSSILFYKFWGLRGVASVLGIELALYLSIKAARRDFWYWASTGGYAVVDLFISIMVRWIIKVTTDWTAVVQFRHPGEVGGAYFTFR